MLSSAQTLAPKPALPPAAPPAPTANAAPAAGGPSFAQFLTQQTPAPAAAPADAEPAAPREAGAEQAQTAKPGAAARRNAQPPAKPVTQNRASEVTPKADPGTTRADKAEEAATEAVAADASADEDDTAATPELKEFTQLLGMAPPQAEAAAARPDPHRPRAAPADEAAERRAGQRIAAAGRAGDTTETAPAHTADARGDKAAPRAAASEEPLRAVASQVETAPAPAAPAAGTTPSFAATLAQALPVPASPADSAPSPTSAAVQSPLHSPAFAPEIGARVSLLAVDGIQQAELQLNPADMGPVAVQIVVDGSQAQVSFHAVQAETRQALEQSLPDLAAALQGQGLTLSGGGVFQQTERDADHGRDDGGGDGGGRASRGGGERVGATTAGSAAPVRRTVGLLDTFA